VPEFSTEIQVRSVIRLSEAYLGTCPSHEWSAKCVRSDREFWAAGTAGGAGSYWMHFGRYGLCLHPKMAAEESRLRAATWAHRHHEGKHPMNNTGEGGVQD
jgi:hypothetical protein